MIKKTVEISIIDKLKTTLVSFKEIQVAILFGSALNNRLHFDSDIDLGIFTSMPLDSEVKFKMIDAVENIAVRSIDLIDIRKANGTILKNIVTKGLWIICKDKLIKAKLISRMLFNQADEMPYYFRILNKRRQRWIETLSEKS